MIERNTELQITDEPAIAYSTCYRLPFLSLFHADCMEIMKQYPDKYFDLAIVDPPYGIGIAEWDKKEHRPTKEYFNELFRVSKNQMVWGGNYFELPISKGWLCWDKSFSDIINKTKYHSNGMAKFELCWTSFLANADFIRFTDIGNVRGFNGVLKVNYKQEKAIHITQKPVEIYEKIIQNYATDGMKILDTHFGSGSIALAVDKANRLDKMNLHLTACEIDKEYIDKAIKRISESIKQGTLSF